MLTLNTLTLAAARQIIFAAETKAYRLACTCTISVVDTYGQLIAQVRMDGAQPSRVDESKNKALNALALGLCMMLHRACGGTQPTGVDMLHGAQIPVGWESDIIGSLKVEIGGIAIESEGGVLGAIGVSSGAGEADHAIALAALEAYSSCQGHDQRSASLVQSLAGHSFFEFR